MIRSRGCPIRRLRVLVRPVSIQPEGRLLACGKFGEGLHPKPAHRFAADARRRHDARLAELADMPAHEWLRKPDVVHQLGHARLATGQPLHDAQPIDVGEGLVECTQRPKFIGLVDDRGDRRADAGGGGGQGRSPVGGAVASTAIYINLR